MQPKTLFRRYLGPSKHSGDSGDLWLRRSHPTTRDIIASSRSTSGYSNHDESLPRPMRVLPRYLLYSPQQTFPAWSWVVWP